MSVSRLSKVLGPLQVSDPKLVNARQILSRSTKLFSDEGLVRLQDGKATLMPLIMRSVRKLEKIIREEMEMISAHEISLPHLVNETLLKATGRDTKEELFKLTDRVKKRFVLAPTNEEAITYLMGKGNHLKESSLPVRFYQINTKFRDEAHPKHGLIRAKEFIMKDLYCFDINEETRNNTYNEVVKQYHNLFKTLKIPYLCVLSSGVDMLSEHSHEFHLASDIGEDELLLCQNCGHNININLAFNMEKCQKCSSSNISVVNGIEVGHAFNIGTAYSEKCKACFLTNTNESKLLEMSCYGIGVTRLLAAAVEVSCTDKELRWPMTLAPYTVCVIPPKEGSKEEFGAKSAVSELYVNLNKHFPGDVVVDDRGKLTIGRRLLTDQKLGFPFIIIIGKEMMSDSPKMEVLDVNTNKKLLVSPSDVINVIKELSVSDSLVCDSCQQSPVTLKRYIKSSFRQFVLDEVPKC